MSRRSPASCIRRFVEDLGLAAAAEALCTRFSQREKVAVQFFETVANDGLSVDIALCLYRILQEALRNVARHAQATHITVTLDVTEGEASLRVVDDGVGLPAGRANRGLGLSSMKERVSLVRGQIRFDSRAGRGTTVVARVPHATADCDGFPRLEQIQTLGSDDDEEANWR